ncbi:helix-hairpin-helix domain-containing protein [Haloarcula laminariae]|uniref:helix-hairpin-helix domain-containing protein n=1 Tax=Haloarcula laminariae TaxID=2961577 RepID=UPI0021C9A830|nr:MULTISPECIES: helix-hairpin-helix domain-containing protein [Halomicroarcula]
MGLLQKLKSALGLDETGSSESGRSGDVDVTVEREPSTEDEDAVKGTETASSGESTGEPDGPGTNGAESGDSSVEEAEVSAGEPDTAAASASDAADDANADTVDDTEADTVDDTDADTEADDADADTEPDDTAADTADDDTDTDTAADDSDADAPADTAGSTDPVTELNGIGPAYGDRLAGAGIDTVGELADADAADLADRIELGESRVAGWIEQANSY